MCFNMNVSGETLAGTGPSPIRRAAIVNAYKAEWQGGNNANCIHTYGQGPIHVMMLHGWLSDCSIFDAIKPLFDPETFTLALVDYRGYGSSTALSG